MDWYKYNSQNDKLSTVDTILFLQISIVEKCRKFIKIVFSNELVTS